MAIKQIQSTQREIPLQNPSPLMLENQKNSSNSFVVLFEKGFLCVAVLVVLECTLYTRKQHVLELRKIHLPLNPWRLVLNTCVPMTSSTTTSTTKSRTITPCDLCKLRILLTFFGLCVWFISLQIWKMQPINYL